MAKENTYFHFSISIRKLFIIAIVFFLIGGISLYVNPKSQNSVVQQAVAARFEYLSKNGNSSCSGNFLKSISTMDDKARLQGSCCSPMDFKKYSEQVKGLQKYKEISEIPADPYDIQAGLAKKLMSYYDSIQLTANEQKEYDYAMQSSKEKGPCCCKCWRWNVYGGLGKYLIQHYQFTGKQITEIWDLSDGCGGNG